MKFGPHFRSAFDSVFAGKAKRAFRPAPPARFLLHIEEHEMRVGVPCVIAVLVMDCRDKPSNTLGQSLGKCTHQRLSLRRAGLDRQSDDKALTDASLTPLSLFFGKEGSHGAGVARKSFLHHHTRGLGPGDVAKMGRCLARLCCTGFNRTLLRECLYRMPKRKQCHLFREGGVDKNHVFIRCAPSLSPFGKEIGN